MPAPATPKFTTASQSYNIRGTTGYFTVSGACNATQQVVEIQVNAVTQRHDYVPASRGTWSCQYLPISAGANVIRVRAFNFESEYSGWSSPTITVTAVNIAITDIFAANIISKIAHDHHTFLSTDTDILAVVSAANICYDRELNHFPNIVIRNIRAEQSEVLAQVFQYRVTWECICTTKDHFNPNDGKYDATGLSDSKQGSAAIAELVRSQTLPEVATATFNYLAELISGGIEEQDRKSEDPLVSSHIVRFEAIYMKARDR